ncbi:MAG TPA: hypothetical protein VH044_04455 [Polyangiaceae bacterium]|nr:hypothetical protein [Polyangiaceae bacterium]
MTSVAPPPTGAVSAVEPVAAVPEASASTVILDAMVALTAGAPASRKPPHPAGRPRGSPCDEGSPRSCAAGLACCQTGFHGHCGGANIPLEREEPCVVTSTCQPAPCTPMQFPP